MNIVINKNHDCINTFQMRVARYWNKIPDNVKLSSDVKNFKQNLETYKQKCFEMKGNYWEISDEVFNRINDNNRQSYVDFMTQNPFIAKRNLVNAHI